MFENRYSVQIKRIKYSGSPFKGNLLKRKILGNATKLRNVPDGHKFNKVFIKPNLTEKQQEESKNLQAELKKRRDKEPTKRMKISKGKIVVLPNSQ